MTTGSIRGHLGTGSIRSALLAAMKKKITDRIGDPQQVNDETPPKGTSPLPPAVPLPPFYAKRNS